MMLKILRGLAGAGLCCLASGCSDREPEQLARWKVALRSPEAALLSVHGTSAVDVWMVGADAGEGPLVLHWDGFELRRENTAGLGADLWWVQALPGGVVFMAGSGGSVLEWREGSFRRLETPLATAVVFGVWAASERDVYAVGSVDGSAGFVWHFDGDAWLDVPLPGGVPLDPEGATPGLFKVWGSSPEDVWVVGDRGLVLRGNAAAGFALVDSGVTERLFTVHGAADRVVMVGGSSNALALEASGDGALTAITPPGAGLLQGVSLSAAGDLWTVGLGGGVFSLPAGSQQWNETFVEPVQSLHAVWADPLGGVWAVGGNVLVSELDGGLVLHLGLNPSEPLALPPVP